MIEDQESPVSPTVDTAPQQRVFTQTEVNKLLRNNKLELREKLREAESLLSNANLEKGKSQSQIAEIEDRQAKAIAEREAALASEWTTKLSERDAQHTASLTEWQTKSSEAESKLADVTSRYHQHRITHELLSAATSGDAVNPRIVTKLLSDRSTVQDDRVLVDFGGQLVPPSEAVQHMREQVDEFGSLFKSPMVGGIGGQSGSKLSPGRIDIKSLSPEQYRDMRSKTPELLGLRGQQ